MDVNWNSQKNITDAERAAFKKALTIYYTRGGPIADAFAQVEPGLIDRYYRRKKAYPDEIVEIERDAKAAALRERSGDQLAFEARQERLSWEMQERAGDIALELIDELARIARGEPRVVEIKDGEGSVRYKTIIPYPRDQIAASKALLDTARHGILPQKYWAGKGSPGEQEEGERGGLMPLFSGNTAFKRIEGTGPDGTKISMTVDDYKDAVTEADDGVDAD